MIIGTINVYSDTLTITMNETNSIDTAIMLEAPTTNYGTNPDLFIQPYATATNVKRILIKPNLSLIPTGAIIQNATLRLYLVTTSGSGLITVNTHEVTKNWVESQATWNQYSTGNNWATTGGDYNSFVIGSFTVDATLGVYYNISLNTTILQAELNNATYYGWLLKGSSENIGVNNKIFNSSEALANVRPQLVITYTLSISSNETLTLRSNYSNSALTNYSAQIVGSGYAQTFNDTAGTVTLNILQNDTRLFNITYTKVNWFNKTYYNVNVSTAHTGYIEQSYINFSLRQQVTNNSYTNYTIKLNGTVVCNTSTAFCQIAYPDAGFYILNATPNNGVEFHALNTNVTITALQNNTVYLYTHDHNVNIQARDSITNVSILIYNVTSQSYNRTDVRTTGTTNGNVSVDVIHDTYNFTIDAPGYALYNNVQNLTVTSEHNLTFYLQRTNGVAISIFNEANGSSLNGVDVTVYVYIDNATLLYTNVTNTSTISYYNLTAGNYTFRFEATNYAVKEYYVNVGNRSFQYLNAYMLQTSSNTIFTFLDQTNGNVIDGVNVIVKKYINGSLVVVSSLTSDITGRVQLSYQANTPYYFTCTKGEYDNKEFTLNPILFSTYTVKMTPSVSEVYEADYSGVSITHTPKRLNNAQNNRIFFTFGSPAGKFVLYGFNVTYNGTTNVTTGVNAYGEIIDTYININNARIGQTAQVQYFYTTSDGATNNYAFNMEIVGQTMNINNTILANKDQTYGLGLFERVFIITIILIIMAGAGALYGGALIGSAIAIFILGIFSYLGFIPWFIGYPTMLFLFIYIVWGSSK